MIILVRLITDLTAAEWMAQALLVLFRVIGDPHVDDEEKILPTDLIGRLARIPSGLQQRNSLEKNNQKKIFFKVLECINIQV